MYRRSLELELISNYFVVFYCFIPPINSSTQYLTVKYSYGDFDSYSLASCLFKAFLKPHVSGIVSVRTLVICRLFAG